MGSTVNLGIWNSNQLRRIKVDNVDLENKVEVLKSQAYKLINNESSKIELSFCGVILENQNSLSSYGVTPGVTIHVLEKPKQKPVSTNKKLTEGELITSVRDLTLLSGYRTALQRLSRKEVLDKIIAATPGLSDDPAAVAIIQDPELIVYLSDPLTVSRIAKDHPILLEAANHVIAHVHEEQANANPNQASTSTGYSYSLEALSDDDDMESTSDTNISQHPLTRNSSFNAITAAQLAAAIANATNTQFNTNSAGVPTNNSSNIITSEMFSNAMQQAIAYGGPSNGTFPTGTPTRNDEESLESLTRRWQVQLQQMHEMGLSNDSVNIRALRATSGDVNAAIELVLSLN